MSARSRKDLLRRTVRNNDDCESDRVSRIDSANQISSPDVVVRGIDDVREPSRANEIVDAALEKLKSTEHWGLAPHAPLTASANLYRRCEEIARSEDVPLTTHLAESREEMSMFRDASGPLYEFLKEIGRDMSDCGQETPLAHFMRHIDFEDPWLITHLNELVKSDFDLLRRSKPNFHIIYCPRSRKYFGHSPFEFETLREFGFNVASEPTVWQQ